MSIRFRLTLLYSLILALTLVAFSLIIYVTQARASLNSAKKTLAVGAEYLVDGPLTHRLIGKVFKLPAPARFGTFLQIRSLEGDVLNQSPQLDDPPVLPLSGEAIQAARRGETWVEITPVDSERLLIHNQPFTAEDGTPLILQLAGSLAAQDQNLNTLGQILIAGSVVAVVVAFGGGWLLAGLTLRPINRLRQTAQTIGAEQDFNRRVDHTGPNDEIGQLATTFNDMLARLQAAYLQVEETLQAQRRLVADASHELRTPLTTLRGNISLLQRQPPISGEDRTDILADMVDETERLMRLVNDLLVLARADAGRSLSQEPVSLKPLLDDVYQRVKLLAPHRTIHYQPAADTSVMGNSDALKQVLLILLDNAFKHTPSEAAVTLTTAVNNGHVAIAVADDGPGISPAHLPHIFNRFYRGDEARSGPGTGLGLAIASKLTQAQNGTLTVQSQPGQGATFTLTFPANLEDPKGLVDF